MGPASELMERFSRLAEQCGLDIAKWSDSYRRAHGA
jgi:hypothetical protein